MANNNFQIAKDIVASYGARIEVVKRTIDDTRELLEEFRNKREKMSQELKGALSQHESLRKKDFDKMMEDILIAQKTREENVKNMLANFENQEMGVLGNLKAMLMKGEKLRLKDFKKTLSKIREEQEIRQKETPERINEEVLHMRSEVQSLLENFKREREKVASEWEGMTALMVQKRNLNKG